MNTHIMMNVSYDIRVDYVAWCVPQTEVSGKYYIIFFFIDKFSQFYENKDI